MKLQIGLEIDDSGQPVLRVIGANEDGTFTPLGVCSGPMQTIRAYAVAFVDEWMQTVIEQEHDDDERPDDTEAN